MGFVALRVTAFAMLLHLSQVTPGLSCTFTLLNVTHLTNLNQVASEPGYPKCLEKCYETEDCSYVVLDRGGFDCFVYAPGEGEVTRDLFIQPDFYQFDRDVSITSCPTVKEWIAKGYGGGQRERDTSLHAQNGSDQMLPIPNLMLPMNEHI